MGGAMKTENIANENMPIERMREREKTNRKRYYDISTSPVCSNVSSVRADVLLDRSKRYFKISLTPIRFGFYTFGDGDGGCKAIATGDQVGTKPGSTRGITPSPMLPPG